MIGTRSSQPEAPVVCHGPEVGDSSPSIPFWESLTWSGAAGLESVLLRARAAMFYVG